MLQLVCMYTLLEQIYHKCFQEEFDFSFLIW